MNLLLSDPAFLSVTSGVSYDLDAAAYIARVEGASGDNQTLEAAVKDAINAFVVGCKADGIWSAIKASCILAGARTLNGALQPLVGTAPTNNNFVTGDYNRVTGLKGDGTTKWLAANRALNADPQNNNHMACSVSEVATGSFDVYIGRGTGATTGATHIGRNSASDLYIRNRSTVAFTPANSNTTGFMGLSRSNSTGFVGRFSGVSNTYSTPSQSPSALDIGVFHNIDQSLHSDARLAFYSIGESLDLALLDARVATLINAFSVAIP